MHGQCRRANSRAALEPLLVRVQEDTNDLAGLYRWDDSACHLLLLSRDGEAIPINRVMDRITAERRLRSQCHIDCAGHEDPADAGVRALLALVASNARDRVSQ